MMNQGKGNHLLWNPIRLQDTLFGFSESVEHKMTYKILNEMTGKILVQNRRVFDYDVAEPNAVEPNVYNADEDTKHR